MITAAATGILFNFLFFFFFCTFFILIFNFFFFLFAFFFLTLSCYVHTPVPATGAFPYTLHRNHREFAIPNELEQFVQFLEPHRIRYRDASAVLLHNSDITIRYEFSGYDVSYQFQGDLRGKDLIDYFDVDCVYSDQNPRQNSYGAVAGLGTIQRMKLWRDRYGLYYSLSFYANRIDPRRHHEYQTHMFDAGIRSIDEQHRRLRLYVRGRRGSRPSGRHGSSMFNNPFHRSRQRLGGGSRQSTHSEASLPFRYLGVQFTDEEGESGKYVWEASRVVIDGPHTLTVPFFFFFFSRSDFYRFQTRWAEAHHDGVDFNGVPFPPDYIELPGAHINDENAYEMEGDFPNGDEPNHPHS